MPDSGVDQWMRMLRGVTMTIIYSTIPGVASALDAAELAWTDAAGPLDFHLNVIDDASMYGSLLAQVETSIFPPHQIVGCSILLDPSYHWGDASVDPSAYDLQGVLTQQLGGCLGLDREPAGCHCAMGPFVQGSIKNRTVTDEDVAALQEPSDLLLPGMNCDMSAGGVSSVGGIILLIALLSFLLVFR